MQFLILYVAACALVAYAGRRRRIGSIGFFLLSFFLSPILAYLILMLSAPAKGQSVY